MIPLAIWLVLLGYTVVWTGRQNLGLSYRPQADGSLQVVDSGGQPAKTWTLLDAVTCGQASGQTPAVPGAQTPKTTGATPPPTVNLGPIPLPNLGAIKIPNFGPIPLPNPGPISIPRPQPVPLPGGIGIIDRIGVGLHDLLNPLVHGVEGLVP